MKELRVSIEIGCDDLHAYTVAFSKDKRQWTVLRFNFLTYTFRAHSHT
jgi:hypothetical protein